MSNYSSLKATIDANVKANNNQEITGAILNSVLNAVVNSMGAKYQYAGVATPDTDPGTPDQNLFYIATTPGTYTNFGGIVVASGECVVLKGTGSTWSKEDTGIDLVSVSQNTSTGHTDITIGSTTTPVASVEEVSQLGQQVIYDVTANNADAKFASLSALLSSENLSTLIPIAVRCGGMSIRFVQSSDNKYVQFRLMSDSFNTTVTNWQGVDAELIAGSDNLVSGGGVVKAFEKGLLKEAFISPSFTDVTTLYIKKGDKIYSTVNEWYEGVFVFTSTSNYFVGNIYDNESDAIAACTGVKLYYNAELTLAFVIDWSCAYVSSIEIPISDITAYNTYDNKPTLKNLLSTGLLKEVYISPSFTNVTNLSVLRGNKVYGSRDEWYEGVLVFTSNNNYFVGNIYDNESDAIAACTGVKLYYNAELSLTFVIDWSCAANAPVIEIPISDITDYNTYDNKPTIKNLILSRDFNLIKEMYVSPSIATYDNIRNINVLRGHKIYDARNEWYNGIFFEVYNGQVLSGYVFMTNVYDSQEAALAESKDQKLYSNAENTAVAVIDWGIIRSSSDEDSSTLFVYDAQPDYNSYKDKPIITEYLTRLNINTWINYYPDLIKHLPVFSAAVCGLEKDVNIIMLGDSFFAAQGTAPLNANAANLPPQCARKHIQYQIWDKLCFNKPQYDRFDSLINPFTEIGTFAQSGETYPTIWESQTIPTQSQAKATDSPLNRYSSTANASVSFGWNMADYEKLNFIYRKSNAIDNADDVNTLGTSAALVTISGGNGKALVYNGSEWVEANGYTFSMRIDNTGDGYAATMPDVKLRFKKVTTDNITVTISNQANDGVLYYWGTERWNRMSLFITNISRGGFNGAMLQKNIINDIGDRECDLLLYELPLSNYSGYPLSDTKEAENSIIQYSGNVAWKNLANFKALSDNYTKFDLLCVIPHLRRLYIETNSDIFKPTTGDNNITYKQFFDNIRGFLDGIGVNYIPLYKNWIDSSRDVYKNFYDAGLAREDNSSHPNELGCEVYARVIEPVIEI